MTHTVLICDDTPYIRTLMSSILERAGFEVVGTAESGAEAVEKYMQLRPDVVTMDIVMREMGGLDAVRQIRSLDDRARILVCSGIAPAGLVDEALAAGAREFVMKPFHPSRLLEAVHSALA